MNKIIFDKSFIKSGIYGIKCLENKKIYVGSSELIFNRLKHHNFLLNNSRHHNKELQNDFNNNLTFKAVLLQELTKQEPKQLRIAIEHIYMIELLKSGYELYNTSSIPYDIPPIEYFSNYAVSMIDHLYNIEFNTHYFKYIDHKNE